jgi:hypothetical protein
VLSLHGLAADWAVVASGELGLGDGGVHCAEADEAGFEGVGEPVVGFDLGGEKGVSAALRLKKQRAGMHYQ